MVGAGSGDLLYLPPLLGLLRELSLWFILLSLLDRPLELLITWRVVLLASLDCHEFRKHFSNLKLHQQNIMVNIWWSATGIIH